jgi:hypothetical protein
MFGGTTISLILPKLIRSVTRDGIWTFWFDTATAPCRYIYLTTHGKPAAFNGKPAKTTDICVLDFNKITFP